ncbi:PAS domain S-box protein [Desulfobacula phenolica]|uniref:PAS domain S-box-containing protein/HDIG domain-containing protein n=1 Tax=Desulfobacula phenolica TaxID=90732 RepID=A0A1H2E025_9BACT|nr:PAS domain S-box protein [Desulfobacula phenolica]SDT88048.1 PAS domain S-box-containing protein/HDIG domain-containing protein [Desulfobacula phenolica]
MHYPIEQDQIKSFFTYSPIGTYVVQGHKFRFTNTKFQKISGYSENELLKMNPLDLVIEEDRQKVRDNAVAMLKHKRKEPYEFRVVTANGETRWVIESVDAIEFEGQKAVVGHFMDVTETKQIEKKLKISEQKYRSIFELVREGIIITSYSNGNIIDANMEFQRQTGYLLSELKQKKVWELQPPEFQKEAQESFYRFKENPGGITSWNLCQNQEGKILPVEIIAQHMFISGQDMIICMVRDTSEREAMMRALTLASEEWRKSFDALDDAVMLINPDFKIRRANMATSRLLNIEISQLIGMRCYNLFHDMDTPPQYCPHLKAQNTGIYCEAEEYESHLNRTLHFCASPIKDNKGKITHTVEVISDVTTHRQNEKESLRLSKDLANSFKGITEALSELVESRDPYTAGHSKHVAKLAVKVGKMMGLNKNELEGLNVCALLHDIGKAIIPAAILNKPGKLSKHEWGFIREHPTTAFETLRRIPFPWPVADVVHQHHERLDGTGYPLGISGDKIHLWARIISVADIFDAMTSHRPYRPGLPLKEAIDELSAGLNIQYDSKVVDAIIHVMRMNDSHVMVVDYDPSIVEGVSAELKLAGLEPIGVTTSGDALKKILEKSFSMAIIELEMPEINGVQLTQKIKSLYPDCEVILIAKCDSKEGSLKALRSGASDFLEKPINSILFKKSISRAVQRYASRKHR